MLFLKSLLLAGFFSGIMSIPFVSHPFGYCLLLLGGSMCYLGFVFMCVSLTWYLVLFSLIYVGGIFVLVVYLASFDSNSFVWFSGGWLWVVWVWVSIFFFFLGLAFYGSLGLVENSYHLCTLEAGFSYCFFCIVLLISFGLVSSVSSSNGGFHR